MASNSIKTWRARSEVRCRVPLHTTTEASVLEQLWQCDQTGEVWWRRVPVIVGWESDEP